MRQTSQSIHDKIAKEQRFYCCFYLEITMTHLPLGRCSLKQNNQSLLERWSQKTKLDCVQFPREMCD